MTRQSELKRGLEQALSALGHIQLDPKLDDYDKDRLEEIIETLHDISSGVAR